MCSVHPGVGISVTNLDEAHVKRAMIQGAAEVVGLVTAQKLDTAATYVVESIHALTYLVTAVTVPHELLVAYKDLDITIIRLVIQETALRQGIEGEQQEFKERGLSTFLSFPENSCIAEYIDLTHT
jgi:hypothetical protein